MISVNIGIYWLFKMHYQGRAYMQKTRANIHRYQFINHMIESSILIS